jgi:hypothetical protein
MRRKPICSASPSLSSGPRRASITRRSATEKVKNASTSKAVRSRGRRLSPRYVACQLFMLLTPLTEGYHSRPKQANSNRLRQLRKISPTPTKPADLNRHFWHGNQGDPQMPILPNRIRRLSFFAASCLVRRCRRQAGGSFSLPKKNSASALWRWAVHLGRENDGAKLDDCSRPTTDLQQYLPRAASSQRGGSNLKSEQS